MKKEMNMEWEDYIENYFFTNNYGNYLVDLLFRRKLIIGDCNPDKWCCLFNNIQKWKNQYLSLGESLEVISFQAWYIHIDFCKFSLPLDKNYDIEEVIAKIFMIIWSLDFADDDTEKGCYINQPFDEVFSTDFNYPKEQCANLSKTDFINELLNIYNLSFDRFQHDKKHNNNSLEWEKKLEANYSKFKNYIQFFETTLHNEEIVRLNTFKLDEYLWYFIKTDTFVYVIQITDFG